MSFLKGTSPIFVVGVDCSSTVSRILTEFERKSDHRQIRNIVGNMTQGGIEIEMNRSSDGACSNWRLHACVRPTYTSREICFIKRVFEGEGSMQSEEENFGKLCSSYK